MTPTWLDEFEKKHSLPQKPTKEKEELTLEPKADSSGSLIVNPPSRDPQQSVLEEEQQKQQVDLDPSDEEQREPGANLGQEKKKNSGSDTTDEDRPEVHSVEVTAEMPAGIFNKAWWGEKFGNFHFREPNYRGKLKAVEKFGVEVV